MKKKYISCSVIIVFVISFISVFLFFKNSDMLLENFNYKKFKIERIDNEIIILKDRHIRNNKIYGLNYLAPTGIYIYYNPTSSCTKFVIWNVSEIYTTNNEKIFWLKLNRDIPAKLKEQKIYLINFCNQTSMIDEFLEKLRVQEQFEENEVDFYSLTPEHENDIGYFYYNKFGSFITFVKYDLCTCGSDSWIEFNEENNLHNKIRIFTNRFYY